MIQPFFSSQISQSNLLSPQQARPTHPRNQGNCIADIMELGPIYAAAESDNDFNANGADPTAYRGDGNPAFDEYRGFTVYSQATDTQSFLRTDFIGTKDAFFWDGAVVNGVIPGVIGLAIPRVLGANRSGMPGGFIQFHQLTHDYMTFNNVRVDPSQSPDPDLGVVKVNRNSFMPAGPGAFPYTYTNVPGGGQCDGVLADAKFGTDNGTQSILLHLDSIETCEITDGFASGDFLAMIVAHETAHRSSLRHPFRILDYRAYKDPATLGINEFTINVTDAVSGNALVDLLVPVYEWPVGSKSPRVAIQERPPYLFGDDTRQFQSVPNPQLLRPFVAPLDLTPLRFWVSGTPLAPVENVQDRRMTIQYQRGYVMDWNPRPTFIATFCTKVSCP